MYFHVLMLASASNTTIITYGLRMKLTDKRSWDGKIGQILQPPTQTFRYSYDPCKIVV